MTLVTTIRDVTTGSVVLDLTPANGYRRVGKISAVGVTWRPEEVSSPYVDGDFEASNAKAAERMGLPLKVTGSSWAQVETRVEALLAAVATDFLFDIGASGVTRTYRASRADANVSLDPEDLRLIRRFATLTFKVQPNPTVTGV